MPHRQEMRLLPCRFDRKKNARSSKDAYSTSRTDATRTHFVLCRPFRAATFRLCCIPPFVRAMSDHGSSDLFSTAPLVNEPRTKQQARIRAGAAAVAWILVFIVETSIVDVVSSGGAGGGPAPSMLWLLLLPTETTPLPEMHKCSASTSVWRRQWWQWGRRSSPTSKYSTSSGRWYMLSSLPKINPACTVCEPEVQWWSLSRGWGEGRPGDAAHQRHVSATRVPGYLTHRERHTDLSVGRGLASVVNRPRPKLPKRGGTLWDGGALGAGKSSPVATKHQPRYKRVSPAHAERVHEAVAGKARAGGARFPRRGGWCRHGSPSGGGGTTGDHGISDADGLYDVTEERAGVEGCAVDWCLTEA
ncbi:hypothetical protein C8R43DRAFT_942595 [Mycena crocata]|nr:hypothetical protein C8R43DRAFT_942595 [Mycena crocata]